LGNLGGDSGGTGGFARALLMRKVCLVPRVSGVGGMVSFRSRFSTGCNTRGVSTTDNIHDESIDSVLVIGGTRDLSGLWRAKTRGIRIVQRLNGMNWLHRRLKTGMRHYLRAEYGNLILRIIRSKIADHIVYQSVFARNWWENTWGVSGIPLSIIYNAVNLEDYSPVERGSSEGYTMPEDRFRVLLVEGSLMGGYEMGLETVVALIGLLNNAHSRSLGKPVELIVAGRVTEALKNKWSLQLESPHIWADLVPSEGIPALDRSAHLLYSADINAACPNAVIEALACGTPVLAFNTGALPELVTADSGRIIPYGGDPWKLEKPDIHSLAVGAVEIINNQAVFRRNARRRAEAAFDLNNMVDAYLSALYPD
jgi:glycosyltransferase involved in cell wall biosynthesis